MTAVLHNTVSLFKQGGFPHKFNLFLVCPCASYLLGADYVDFDDYNNRYILRMHVFTFFFKKRDSINGLCYIYNTLQKKDNQNKTKQPFFMANPAGPRCTAHDVSVYEARRQRVKRTFARTCN